MLHSLKCRKSCMSSMVYYIVKDTVCPYHLRHFRHSWCSYVFFSVRTNCMFSNFNFINGIVFDSSTHPRYIAIFYFNVGIITVVSLFYHLHSRSIRIIPSTINLFDSIHNLFLRLSSMYRTNNGINIMVAENCYDVHV